MVKRHTKANPYAKTPGGIIEKESALDISNVALVCDACAKPTRVGYKYTPEGKKVRFCKEVQPRNRLSAKGNGMTRLEKLYAEKVARSCKKSSGTPPACKSPGSPSSRSIWDWARRAPIIDY